MKKFLDHLKSGSSKLSLEESEIRFVVNEQDVTIKNGEIPSTLSLAKFLRSHLSLTGTKVMCNQAGCGACIVTAYVPDEKAEKGYKVISVNSCVTPVLSCDGWHIVTVEGLGSRKEGMHPIQARLAAFHGTQCGFCSPGMVMQMNSLREKNPDAKMQDIEHILDGNMCRCTGYRPIHDAFKSFAVDASESIKKALADIEELGSCQGQGKSICPRTGQACGGSDKKSCSTSSKLTVKHQDNEEGHWYMPNNLDELLAILTHLPDGTKYRLVGGNTATGIYQDGPYDVYIDVKKVSELTKVSKAPLEVGGGVVLNEWMELMENVSKENEAYSYGQVIVDHLKVVASTGVRNTGTLAGNLMIKHAHQYFPSDCFIMLETLGANINVKEANGKEFKYSPKDWLSIDMDRKVVTKICLPALSQTHVYRTFKITPRQVHAHAYVNAGFLFNMGDGYKVKEKPSICFGGIREGFVHAVKTEDYLTGKCLNDPNVMQIALKTLAEELNPEFAILEADPEYRRNLAQGLLYKTILGVISQTLEPKMKSGAENLNRFKQVSQGSHFYKSDEEMWPMNKGVPKVEGKAQCTGEAEYINDIPPVHGELHAALVQAKQANCELDVVDPAPALALPGVKHFIDHTCVPGRNSWVPWADAEEVFSTGKIHYAGQSIGLILAETPELALKAVDLVKVTYKNKKPVVSNIRQGLKDKSRQVTEFPEFFGFNAKQIKVGQTEEQEKREDLTVIEGELELGSQYHFYMETLTALCRPKEDNQIQLWASTQWMDFTTNLVAAALGIKIHQIDMNVRRLGGGYGGKATPAFFVAVATSIAAWKVNKSVRFVMDLKSNMSFIGLREPYIVKYKAGVDSSNKLQFVDCNFFGDCGYSTSEFLTMAELLQFAQNAYNATSWTMTPIAVVTDKPRGTATRAPGTTQGHAIIENLMEHMAAKLNIDPVDFRLNNFIKDGDMTLAGHPFHGKNPLPGMITDLRKSANFEERKANVDSFNQANKWKKRGLSLVPVKYGIHGFAPMPYYAHISIYEGDGSISVSHGGIEMGQGINTKVAQTVAKELGVPLESVIVKPSDVLVAPNNCVTGGSTTSELTCHAAKRACEYLKDRMAPIATAMEGAKWHEIVQACFFKGIDLAARHMGHSGNDKLNGYNIWAVILSEVEIDLLTGERNILRCDLLEDTGATINPEVDIGQIEGGFVFSIGWWLQEQIKHCPETGQLLTNDTWEYKPPSCYDIPGDMRTTLCETNRMEGTLGSKATGEPSMLMGCSVAFAIRDALKAARQDLGIPGDQNIPGWINISGPLTVEKQYLLSGVNPEMYTLH